jgi:hypothetical protein
VRVLSCFDHCNGAAVRAGKGAHSGGDDEIINKFAAKEVEFGAAKIPFARLSD